MSEASRSRVTITLGRTGQVVKRTGGSLEEGSFAGSKRSVRDRLGDTRVDDSSFEFSNKRARGDGRYAGAFDEVNLRKDDLRYKIMQKKSQKSQQTGMDLRNILSRPAQSSTNSISTKDKMPPPKDTRPQYMEPIDIRQHFMDPRDGRALMPTARSSSQYIKDYRDLHVLDPREQRIPEARESERRVPLPEDVRRRIPEPNSYGVLDHVNSRRPTNSVSRMESDLDSYSPWNLESLRRRSPDETLATPRGIPVQTRDEELPRRFAVRTNDDAKMSPYLNGDALEYSRPMSSLSSLSKPTSMGPMKAMAPMLAAPLPLPGSLSQKSSIVVDDNVTVDSFLRSLGLERYAILFKAEEVDMYSLNRMVDSDLKEIGIPMGPRKKILLALHPLVKRLA